MKYLIAFAVIFIIANVARYPIGFLAVLALTVVVVTVRFVAVSMHREAAERRANR